MDMHKKLVQFHEEAAADELRYAGKAEREDPFFPAYEEDIKQARFVAGMHIATVNMLNGVGPE